MLSRIKAIMQIVGLLLMENGIFLIALGLVENVPLMVELGITFDILVAAIVMGTFVYKIGQTFESIDVDDLKFLKG
jgi:hydrogenase-4 component E